MRRGVLACPGREVRNPGLSEARGRALLAILSSLFGWLQRQRRVATNPCAGIRSPAGIEAARARVEQRRASLVLVGVRRGRGAVPIDLPVTGS